MRPIILHIPHSSIEIPDYSNFCISEIDVNKEALYLTDYYTDELFQGE